MLTRENRLADSKDFQKVFQEGQSFANRNLVLYHKRRTSDEPFRLGLSVSKKIGNAVVRNRVRRLLREAFRAVMNERAVSFKGVDFVIIARVPAANLGLEEMKQNVAHLLERCGYINKMKSPSSNLNNRDQD